MSFGPFLSLGLAVLPAAARAATNTSRGTATVTKRFFSGSPSSAAVARDLPEIVEDRYDAGSVLITNQAPFDRWYEMIAIPTLADAVLDCVIHNACRIELSGDNLRKHCPADQPA